MNQRTRTKRPPRRSPKARPPLTPVPGGPDSIVPKVSLEAPKPLVLVQANKGKEKSEPVPSAPAEGGEALSDEKAVPEVEAASTEAPAEVELIIPPPPPDMQSRAMGGARRAGGNMGDAGTATRALPEAETNTSDARANVQEPQSETDARAQSGLTEALRERPAPSPEVEQLCADIQDAIENRRPVDEADLRRADPEAEAQAVGDQLNGDISEDSARVQGEYDEVNTPPVGEAAQVSEPIPDTPNVVSTPDVNASSANPAAVPPEDLSLDNDLAATQGSVDDAGMTSEVANVITTGPVAEAREGMGELATAAAEAPGVVEQQQADAITNSRSAMRRSESNALEILERSRTATIEDTLTRQTDLVGSEQDQREAASTASAAIFTQAQTDVNDLLSPLVTTAMERWNTGKERIAREFDDELQRAKDMVDERHDGIGGAIVSIWDDVTGLPSSITRIYDSAERTFGQDICTLIREVSTYVNGVIIACEEIIDNADTRIQAVFDSLPEDLQTWAAGQVEGFQGQLNGLRDTVQTTQDDFTDDLVNQAANAVQEARERIDALREAAKGLIQKVADAVEAFLDDPVKAIIDGLLTIVGIAPASFWALIARIEQVASDIADDPMNFANNLLAAVQLGFQNFFDNFFSHVLSGFINWLMSAMGTVGVELPADTSVKSLITFFLQVMGITWPRIREILVRHIGEQNVELLEKAYELLNVLIEQGPQGIYEMVKDKLDPATIMNTIIEAAVSFMVETIVGQAILRIVGLFNPVGAIAQAVEAIYKVLKWIFENAARIFTLVETIVGGVADLIAGNIAGMAEKTEAALSGMMVPVIDFVAGFLGLGDLPEKIADVVGGFQEMVLEAIDELVGFLVAQARSVLAALGIGGDPDADDGDLADDEVGESISFSADGEGHRIYFADGAGLRLMVASTPETLEAKIRRWTNTVTDLPEANRNEARGLLSQASSQLGITMDEGEQAKLAIVAAEASPDDPAKVQAAQTEDNQTEDAERQLVPTLTRLFELFGEKSVIVEFADQINRMDTLSQPAATSELVSKDPEYMAIGNWSGIEGQLKSASPISSLHSQPLGTAANNGPFQSRNYTSIFVAGLNAALPAVMNATGKTQERLLKNSSPEEYANRRKGVIHGSDGIGEGEEGSATARQQVLDSLQQLLFSGGATGPAQGHATQYFTKSLEGFSVHSDYRPQNIQAKLENGNLIVTYDYGDDSERDGGPRDFVATIGVSFINSALILQSTRGNALALKVPGTRGYTVASGNLASKEGVADIPMDSAHILADQFMGSGYKTALNLVVTSANYNRVVMATAEQSIVEQVKAIQLANAQKLTTFDIQVTAHWKPLPDDPVVSAVQNILPSATSNLTPADLQTLADTTMTTFNGKQDPRVCQLVTYRGMVYADGALVGLVQADTNPPEDTTLANAIT